MAYTIYRNSLSSIYYQLNLRVKPLENGSCVPENISKLNELVLEHIACLIIGHEWFNFFSVDLNNFNLKTVWLQSVLVTIRWIWQQAVTDLGTDSH